MSFMKLYNAQTQQGHSYGFFEYIRRIGEATSKQEEDEIVTRDLRELKASLADPNVDKNLYNEFAVRVFYAEMLGHSADFGHIHCVNLCSHPDLLFKRTGYLSTWLCVSPEHDFMYLIVATMQKDMKSTNYLDVSAALTAATKLLRPELIPTVTTEVGALLKHPKAIVRRKAVEVLHAFYVKTDGAVGELSLFRQALCDKDPSVVDAALRLLRTVIRRNPTSQRDLFDSFLFILTQLIQRRLPRDYDYHGVPAPWMQMRLVQLLALLVGRDAQLAAKCEPVLIEVMQRADVGLVIGFAIICEVIRAVAVMPPLPSLLELSTEAVHKFITSPSANLRYVGLQALSQLVNVSPSLAEHHQRGILHCLEDSDDTIRRNTVSLLFAMCTEDNIEPIADRIIHLVARTTTAADPYMKRSVVRGLCMVVERFAPSAAWFLSTMNRLLLVASEYVPPSAVQRMLKLIADGQGNDDAEDAAFRARCVEDYFALTERVGGIPEVLQRVAAWVMGEYGYLTRTLTRSMLLDRLCDLLERTDDAVTREWVVTAMMKLEAHSGSGGRLDVTDNVMELVRRFRNSRSVGLQQRCYEFAELVTMPLVMPRVLPLDGCCEEMEVDPEMHFLDALVAQALRDGARPYDSGTLRTRAKPIEPALRTEAYKSADTVVSTRAASWNAQLPVSEEGGRLALREGGTRRWGVPVQQEDEEEERQTAPVGEVSRGAAAGHRVWGDGSPSPSPPAVTLQQAGGGTSAWPCASDAQREAGQEEAVATPAPSVVGDTLESVARGRPTRNERFLSDIFGGAKRKHARVAPSTAARPKAAPAVGTRSVRADPTDLLFAPSHVGL